MVDIVISKDQEFLKDCDETYMVAVNLAVSIVEEHFSENETFVLTDSTVGVLLQISNMVSGLQRTPI